MPVDLEHVRLGCEKFPTISWVSHRFQRGSCFNRSARKMFLGHSQQSEFEIPINAANDACLGLQADSFAVTPRSCVEIGDREN